MRKIKEVLRLCWGQGMSKRQAAGSCGISRPAVDGYLRRAEAAGLSWQRYPLSWMTGTSGLLLEEIGMRPRAERTGNSTSDADIPE